MIPFPGHRHHPAPQSRPWRRPLYFAPGQPIYRAGSADSGELAWRLKQGVIRLDIPAADTAPTFANLAVPGDILGCEALLSGTYTFSARALTPCLLFPWPEADAPPSSRSLLESFVKVQKRMVEMIMIRRGQALNRVVELIRLLTDQAGHVVLPARRDIADITGLRVETISRIIKKLERSGKLTVSRTDGVHAARRYAVTPALMDDSAVPITVWPTANSN